MSRFKAKLVNTSALVSQAPDVPAGIPVNPTAPKYSPEAFIEMDIDGYRKAYPNETAGYDDVTLFNVAMIPDDDLSPSEWAELFLKYQPEQEKDEVASAEASSLAAMYAARVSEATEQEMDVAADGKEDWQRGPIMVRQSLISDFTDEETGENAMDNWPIPGSKSGNNPDKYKAQYTDKATGNVSMRPTSFYMQFTRHTSKGAALVTELEYLRRLGNIEAIKTDIPEELQAKYKHDTARKARIKWIEGRLANMTAGYRKAAALHLQLKAFAELGAPDAEGNVKQGAAMCAFIMVTDDEGQDTDQVVNSPSPIMIWADPGINKATGKPLPVKPGDSKAISIGAFLKFKVAQALAAGGSYKAVLKTVERAQKDKGGKGKDAPTTTVDQFVARFVEHHRFMDEITLDKDGSKLASLYAVLKADRDHKDRGELVAAWVETVQEMNRISTELQLNAAYTKIAPRLAKAAA